jgi:putative addiction module CopG family antidote
MEALCEGRSPAYYLSMDSITLTPELEQFAEEAVAAGRYRDVSEVVQAGVALLKQAEAEVSAFVSSLEEARAEGEQDGFLTAEEVHREMTAMLDEMARAKA